MAVRVWEEREIGEFVYNGYRVSVWEDKKVLQMDGGDGYKTMSRYLIPLTRTLKNG